MTHIPFVYTRKSFYRCHYVFCIIRNKGDNADNWYIRDGQGFYNSLRQFQHYNSQWFLWATGDMRTFRTFGIPRPLLLHPSICKFPLFRKCLFHLFLSSTFYLNISINPPFYILAWIQVKWYRGSQNHALPAWIFCPTTIMDTCAFP